MTSQRFCKLLTFFFFLSSMLFWKVIFSKPMRLAKNFGIWQKSKVGHCQQSKFVRNWVVFFRFQLLRKSYQNNWKFWHLSKILVYFWHFWHSTVYVDICLEKIQKNGQNSNQIGQKWLKKGWKIMKIIPGVSTINFWQSTFGISVCVENVPKYLTFDYWLSRYIFPKLLKKSKLLPERMGLNDVKNDVTVFDVLLNMMYPPHCYCLQWAMFPCTMLSSFPI